MTISTECKSFLIFFFQIGTAVNPVPCDFPKIFHSDKNVIFKIQTRVPFNPSPKAVFLLTPTDNHLRVIMEITDSLSAQFWLMYVIGGLQLSILELGLFLHKITMWYDIKHFTWLIFSAVKMATQGWTSRIMPRGRLL